MSGSSDEKREVALPVGYAPMLQVSFLCGMAITFKNGRYHAGALLLVLAALGTLLFSLRAISGERVSQPRSPRILVVVWLGLLAMTVVALNVDIVMYAVRPWHLGRAAQIVAILLLVSYSPFLTGRRREPRRLRLARFGAFAIIVALAGVDVIRTSPTPRIDVWTVQQGGVAALQAGKNPYREVAERDTGPRIAEDVPYVYPPTQLYLTLPAYVLAKDVRFAMLTALLLAGFGMRYLTGRARTGLPSIAEDAPTLYLWLGAKTFFILEQAWVDPVQVMLITLTCCAYVARRPLLTAALLGIVLSAKQTMFWAVGLTGIILRFDRKQWLTTVGLGAALVLPFVLIDFPALKHANFDFLSHLPSRPDALTFNSWYLRAFGRELPGALGFVLAGTIAGASIWLMKPSLARLGVALVATYGAFFAFNKWAFANYYFLIAGLASLAAASACHLGETGPPAGEAASAAAAPPPPP
jgi:hypothetical protein